MFYSISVVSEESFASIFQEFGDAEPSFDAIATLLQSRVDDASFVDDSGLVKPGVEQGLSTCDRGTGIFGRVAERVGS